MRQPKINRKNRNTVMKITGVGIYTFIYSYISENVYKCVFRLLTKTPNSFVSLLHDAFICINFSRHCLIYTSIQPFYNRSSFNFQWQVCKSSLIFPIRINELNHFVCCSLRDWVLCQSQIHITRCKMNNYFPVNKFYKETRKLYPIVIQSICTVTQILLFLTIFIGL